MSADGKSDKISKKRKTSDRFLILYKISQEVGTYFSKKWHCAIMLNRKIEFFTELKHISVYYEKNKR